MKPGKTTRKHIIWKTIDIDERWTDTSLNFV